MATVKVIFKNEKIKIDLSIFIFSFLNKRSSNFYPKLKKIKINKNKQSLFLFIFIFFNFGGLV